MSAEQIDFAAVKADHDGMHRCNGFLHMPEVHTWDKEKGEVGPLAGPCLVYRLAVEAEYLAGREQAVWSERDEARAEAERLAGQLAEERESRHLNSRSARALMDAIRDDPAVPPADLPMLFGERALVVIDARSRHFDHIEGLRSALELQVRDLQGRLRSALADQPEQVQP